ncbi:cyclic nucleotide-binding domain-containing protein [uncultured Aquimarina sp.]|uniref:Crp/Fnr family transcriptional regulator n=1 Tax=uncultured Aquimarina sp. TaxID=575652 RepID=UPI00262B23B9|nr:cyclic nucleotide-binding domain-containing protein [uncultured Aquimarina sp.]
MEDSIELFKNEIYNYTDASFEEEWSTFKLGLKSVSYKKGDVIFPRSKVCTEMLYITEGIVVTEYFNKNEQTITRFFRPKNLCSNISSFLTNEVVNDLVSAVTDVKGVMIPQSLFNESYLYSNGIGLYFRKRLMENLLEDKMFISIKAMGIDTKLDFLYSKYPEIIKQVSWRKIANFLGVTPEWLSKTLKKRTLESLQ